MQYKKFLAGIALLSTLYPQIVIAQIVDDGPILVTPKPAGMSRTCDPLTCQLPQELLITERFLRDRKNGLPYTPDPRPLSSPLEVLRLNQLSQTMGYLNLYRAYPNNVIYKQEALQRVEYFLSLGSEAIGNGPRDGMIGFMLLDAYSLFGDERYLQAGVTIANSCFAFPEKDLMMNGGLMCALGLGAAFKATGNASYRDLSRHIVEQTAPKQFADGAFPHLPTLASGKNLSYTSWMTIELLLLGRTDSEDPYTDFLALKAADFLSHRVKENGTLEFSNATENFDSDPGNENAGIGHDVGGFFSVALNMYATGRPAIASKVLRLGFTQRMGGTNFGGYPDVYGAEQPITNLWLSGKPSVLRTSLIFWYMSMFPSLAPKCTSGTQISCTLPSTPGASCSAGQAAQGECTLPPAGSKFCLAGRYTACMDLPHEAMLSGQVCGEETTCTDTGASACYETCTLFGSQRCVNGVCAGQCYDVNDQGQPAPVCATRCYENRSCGELVSETTPYEIGGVAMCRVEQ